MFHTATTVAEWVELHPRKWIVVILQVILLSMYSSLFSQGGLGSYCSCAYVPYKSLKDLVEFLRLKSTSQMYPDQHSVISLSHLSLL